MFLPLGFGTWQAASSLVVGFLAKELVASSILIICGAETGILALFTPLQAFSFLVFFSTLHPVFIDSRSDVSGDKIVKGNDIDGHLWSSRGLSS